MIPFFPYPGVQGGFHGRKSEKPPFSWGDLLELKQVHGDKIWLIRNKKEAEAARGKEGDAWITSAPDLAIGIRTADCVPILLAHPTGIIAAIHAGWRGTLAGIAGKVLARIQDSFGVEPGDCLGAMGPAICQECLELGKEVGELFLPKLDNKLPLQVRGEKFHLDLRRVNLDQLAAAGLAPERVEISRECTRCNQNDYFSYRGSQSRGEKNDGRNYSWILRST